MRPKGWTEKDLGVELYVLSYLDIDFFRPFFSTCLFFRQQGTARTR